MKFGIVHLIVIVGSATLPARAAVADGAPAVDRSTLSTPGGKSATQAPTVSHGGAAGRDVADLIPLGPPTGAKDELAVQPSGPASAVPEPATLAVFGVGLLLLFRRRSAN